MRNIAIERPSYMEKLKSYTGSDIVRVITGVRRCGKSSLLLMYKDWLEKQYGKDCILYINFDGPDFILDKTLRAMTEAIRSGINGKNTRFLLLDEVQLIDGWENAINAYYSTGQYEITITGSNARMLSSELATLLTGRYTEIEMFPLSFSEYRQFKAPASNSNENLFEEYLLYGGFPITALLDEPELKTNVLQSILDSILFNDVRPKIGSDASNDTLKRLVVFLNDAVGYPVSMNNLEHRIKSAGYKMYHELISKYMSAFRSSFLYYNAEFHTVKGGGRFGQTDKYYPVDTGLVALTKGNMSENYSSLLENAVFLELKRRGFKVSVGKNIGDSSEIDFMAVKGAEKLYVQVTATLMDENTRKREFHALETVKDNFPKYILSMDRHDFSRDGIRNIYIPDFLISELSTTPSYKG